MIIGYIGIIQLEILMIQLDPLGIPARPLGQSAGLAGLAGLALWAVAGLGFVQFVQCFVGPSRPGYRTSDVIGCHLKLLHLWMIWNCCRNFCPC